MKWFFFSSVGIILFGCTNHLTDLKTSNLLEENRINFQDTLTIVDKVDSLYDLVLLTDHNPIILFPFSSNDSVFTSVNYQLLEENISLLTATNLFTKEFIVNYKNIYTQIDSVIQYSNPPLHSSDLPPFFSNASPWCFCQDYPTDEKYFSQMIRDSISLDDSVLHYYWWWNQSSPSTAYHIEFKKVNKDLLIHSLDGFNFENVFE